MQEKERQQWRTGRGSLPSGYICYKCGKDGHFVRERAMGKPPQPPETPQQAKMTHVTLSTGGPAQRLLLSCYNTAEPATSSRARVMATSHGSAQTGTWTTVVGKGSPVEAQATRHRCCQLRR